MILRKQIDLNPLDIARQTVQIEAQALNDLLASLDERFTQCIELITNCSGRVVVTGIGKSALVGQKIVATFNSTGTHALFMHAADAVHGDLGMIADQDLVICISKSGETSELKVLLPILKSYGVCILAMTSNEHSYLSKEADGLLYTPVAEEADPNKLAPTSSTIVQSAMGDAIATVLLSQKGFTPQHFAKYHPGGSLGKQLYLRVSDLCKNNAVPSVSEEIDVKEILLNISKGMLGAIVVIDQEEKILGIITDGDIRRWFQFDDNRKLAIAKNIMSSSPNVISKDALAVNAFQMMRDLKISQLPVVDVDRYVGMIHLNDLLKEGFV